LHIFFSHLLPITHNLSSSHSGHVTIVEERELNSTKVDELQWHALHKSLKMLFIAYNDDICN